MKSGLKGEAKVQTMEYSYDRNFVSGCRLFSRTASIVIALGGVMVFVGWMFDIPLLKSVHPNFVAMKANTAFSFLLTGISLWLLQEKESALPGKVARRMAQICAGIVALIGFLTLGEYLFGWNLGIDQLLFKEPLGAVGTSDLGRMAPNTAFNFLVIGIGLLLLDVRTRRGRRPVQWIILIEGTISLLALIGYLYGAKSFYGPVSAWTVMAVHTAVLFNFVFWAFLSSRPQTGFMVFVSSKGLGGLTLRHLLLPVVIILPLTGWLEVLGERAGFYDSITGVALLTTARIIMFIVLIWLVCKLLERVDRQRLQAEEELLKSKDIEWERTFDTITDFIFILDKDHTLMQVNKAATEALKCRAEDIIGRKCYEVMHKLGTPWPDCPFSLAQKDNHPHSAVVDDPNIGIPLLVTVSPLLNDKGELIGAVHIAKDITELKQKETLLQKAREELEKKVEERTKELRQKLDELESFRKATIGREFRMAELRDEIEQLKAEKGK